MFTQTRALVLSILAFGFLHMSTAHADYYRVLNEGKEAYQARIDLIQQAQKSIDLSYYAWADDAVGRQLLALLRDAATGPKKIAVRLVVNAANNDIPAADRVYLAGAGIEIKDYKPFKLTNPDTWIHSMHNKLLIVDGETLVMGGRNMDAGYFELPAAIKFRDREVIIRGAAVARSQNYFNDLWKSPYVKTIIGKLQSDTLENAATRLADARNALVQEGLFQLDTGTDWLKDERVVSEVQFLHDEIPVRKKVKPVNAGLMELMRNAQRSIIIETAYLSLTKDLVDVLSDALNRGVRVRILTNSLQSNDVQIFQAQYLSGRKKLLKMGAEVYEYAGTTTLHIKSAVIDETYTVIGSYNLDQISRDLNTETVSYISEPEIAREVLEVMDQNLEGNDERPAAFKILPNGKPEGYKRRFPGSSRWNVVKTKLLQFVIVPILKTAT